MPHKFHLYLIIIFIICAISTHLSLDTSFEDNWRKVSMEFKALLLLLTLENILLCLPLLILCNSIRIRNEFLDLKFPQLQEEIGSTNLVYSLVTIMPMIYLAVPFLQFWLFYLYNKYGHPWSKIFKKL